MYSLRIPTATYRIQFNKQFRFENACELVPYLHRLGISDLYTSPILKARRGSTHGYDVVDPLNLNPELGGEADFSELHRELKDLGMGLLLDIVPNHMAACSENPWWADLLENGLCSPYAVFFDIDWHNTGNGILLPILDSPSEQVLENREMLLSLDEAGLFVKYHDLRLPLDIKSYRFVLSHGLNDMEQALGSNHAGFQQILKLMDVMDVLPYVRNLDPREAGVRYRERQSAKEAFCNATNASSDVRTILLRTIGLFNGKKRNQKDSKPMHNLLQQQVYQLAFWKVAINSLNYRRFFDINDLIGIRVEVPAVFEATHSVVLRLAHEGKITGLRIDHIDGLSDPLQYLLYLQRRIRPETEGTAESLGFYVIVEKILSCDEALPSHWQALGTTGYDSANILSSLFIDSGGIQALDKTYRQFTGSRLTFSDVVYQKKKQVVEELFPSEIRMLGEQLTRLAQQNHCPANLCSAELAQALTEVTVCLPVYRTYTRTSTISPRDKSYLESAITEAKRRNQGIDNLAVDFLRRVLTLDYPRHLTPEQRREWLRFVLRWQQFTGAVMAKGFEDTALYSFSRLVSLNEVGGDPSSAGLSIEEFHRLNQERLEYWPHTLNATSTHDTKRSEDVRARINVLSELSDEWEKHLIQWQQWNKPKKPRVNNLSVPEPNIEIMIYQTLLGDWPLFSNLVPEFKERLKDYCIKAVREAKEHSNWLSPDLYYESALSDFLDSSLDNSQENGFLADFLPFCQKVAYYGALNSLAQVLLKVTSPGIPDFYQGTELWDFSLVDPDNRRPVDFEKRGRLLDNLIQQEGQGSRALFCQLLNSWQDGRVKLYLTYKALNTRSACREVFRDGQYIPLQVAGQKREHVVAFSRHKEGTWVLVVIPRLLTRLVDAGTFPLGEKVWGSDQLILPNGMPEKWLSSLTGENLQVSRQERGLLLSDILNTLPVALLVGN